MVIRKCDYCGEDTKNEWKNYCCYWCHVLGEKEKQEKKRNSVAIRRIDENLGVKGICMKKHLFHVSVSFAAGVKFEEIVELPSDFTDDDVEEEFKEWVWNQLDTYRTEV